MARHAGCSMPQPVGRSHANHRETAIFVGPRRARHARHRVLGRCERRVSLSVAMLEPTTGEHVLMQAVLVDAIKNLTGRSSSLDARDAYAWVKSRNRDWAYSFERICEMLDVDAAALRRRLLTPPSPRPTTP